MKTESGLFDVPYIPYERLRREADRIRELHWPSGSVPVDVEKILWRFKLDLVPVPSLKEDDDVDALLLGDLTAIVIDQKYYMDNRKQTRVRFSIAHELRHFILHRDIFQEVAHSSVEEWIHSRQNGPEEQHNRLEFQANEFAGRLLVPVQRLRKDLRSAIAEAKRRGITDLPDEAKQYVANRLSRVFGVSSEVIEKRFDREKLWPPK